MIQLKAGQMGDPSETGMPLAFQGSLAAAIEAALNTVLQGEGFPALALESNTKDDRDRRMIFVAIAQGVIEFLHANEMAIVVADSLGNPGTIDFPQADPL